METYKDSIQENTGEIVVYQPDEITRLEVRVNEETVWLTQGQMAELFQTSPQNITIHIRNIYDEGELQKSQLVRNIYKFNKRVQE